MWMGGIELSVLWKQKDVSAVLAYLYMPLNINILVDAMTLLILPAECTEGCLHHGALKPVKRDGEVAVLCSCVPGCTSSLATLQ